MPKIVHIATQPAGKTQIPDNTSEALDIESTDTKDYITIDTSDGSEVMTLSAGGSAGQSLRIEAGRMRYAASGTMSILAEDPSATNPVFCPNALDDNTGIGRAAADQLSLISGGVEIARAAQFDSGTFQNVLAVGTDIADVVASPQASLHVRNDAVGTQACFQRDAGKLLVEMSGANSTLNSNVDFRVQVGSAVRQCVDSSTGNVGFGTCSATAEVETVGHIDTALTGTFTATNGSTAISSGSSTAFTTELHVGSAIKIGSEIFTVSAIASDTALTLDSAFAGSTASGLSGTTDGGELFAVKTGDSKTLLGMNETGALQLNSSTGDITNGNLSIGDATALDTVTTGKLNTIVGNAPNVYGLTTGHSNSMYGYQSGEALTTGVRNTMLGMGAGYGTGSGVADNTYVGVNAGAQISGSYNVAVGSGALIASGASSNCVALGASALAATTSNSNIGIGKNAGNAITSGSSNICIGSDSDVAATASNQIAIGLDAVTNAANKVRLGNTSVTNIDGEVAFNATSDARTKANVQELALGLDFINALRPVSFTRVHPAEYPAEILDKRFKQGEKVTDKDGNVSFVSTPQFNVETGQPVKDEFDETTRSDGLIAQEVQAVCDSLGVQFNGISTNSQGKLGMQYGLLVSPLIKAVQELTKKLEDAEARIGFLESDAGA